MTLPWMALVRLGIDSLTNLTAFPHVDLWSLNVAPAILVRKGKRAEDCRHTALVAVCGRVSITTQAFHSTIKISYIFLHILIVYLIICSNFCSDKTFN